MCVTRTRGYRFTPRFREVVPWCQSMEPIDLAIGVGGSRGRLKPGFKLHQVSFERNKQTQERVRQIRKYRKLS